MTNNMYLPSHFPLKTFNENFNSQRTEADILSIVSKAEEFEQLKVSSCLELTSNCGLSLRKV